MKNPTKADFKAFKAEFLRCVDLMGLHEWRISFEFCPLDGNYAEIGTQAAELVAHVQMTSAFVDVVASEYFDPIETAQHEAAHLMTARLCHIARSRYIRPEDVAEEWERVTRLIQRLLVKRSK